MARTAAGVDIPTLGQLDRRKGRLGLQLARLLREALRTGALRPGDRLPSTRVLSASLSVARGVVVEAFEQLVAEGVLQSHTGSGTIVAAGLCEARPYANASQQGPSGEPVRLPAPAASLALVAKAFVPHPPVPFAVSVPLGPVAPGDSWRRLARRQRGSGEGSPAGYGDPQGLPVLRNAIADYVRRSRSVHCDPGQIIITSGTQQGLHVAATVLLAPGEAVWTEDPAYPGMTAILNDPGRGLRVAPVPVDREGIDVEFALRSCPQARAAFVTPSHQYPLGMPMSISRRTALLAWARASNAWIVEDDYDSELRYAGHPFPSLQGFDGDRVLYLGTFSKILFPSLRLGYIVAPEPLVAACCGARALMDRYPPGADQHLLAAFITAGHLDAHIRRIRGVYASRRAALMRAIQAHVPPGNHLAPGDQGMHMILWLARGVSDVAVASAALSEGVAVKAISPMYAGRGRRHGLILGFGGFTDTQMDQAAVALGAILRRARAGLVP